MGEEYEAEIKKAKAVLYITQAGADIPERNPQLRLELKPDIDEWKIEGAVAYLAEITETPLTYRLATESGIEVKVKGRRKIGEAR